jgi:hypothetical protein
MMYIVSADERGMHERTWHVGEGLTFSTEQIAAVIEVMADGHELEHILKNFYNMPFRTAKRVNRWFGDHAKFIAANL